MVATRRDGPPLEPVAPQYYIYDIETYPNIFTLAARHHESGTQYMFEISDRKNDFDAFVTWMTWLASNHCSMVGYNSQHFDYPIIHHMMTRSLNRVELIYELAMDLITTKDRFKYSVWPDDVIVPQCDLLKVNHFDNPAKRTRLKELEFNMRMNQIEDLPFPVGTHLNDEQKDKLITYNWHDIDATDEFFEESKIAIDTRRDLSSKYSRDVTNHSDVKLGTDFIVSKLQDAGIQTHARINGKRQPITTPRDKIVVADILFPFIQFSTPELARALAWFKDYTVVNTRAKLDLDSAKVLTSASVEAFSFDFGLGGLHGSVSSQLVKSCDEFVILDIDVESYYPSVAIEYSLYPEHLTEVFCKEYADVKAQRLEYAKGTVENLILKLALNGSYGNSNSPYSPLFDPQFTMSITINGQLMLAMLSEWCLAIEGLSMVQANTDGVTVKCPRSKVDAFRSVYKMWEQLTHLKLEEVEYSRMWIRDVNNYVAETTDGKLKKKGAYVTHPEWHKNHSQLVVPRAAIEHMTTGKSVEDIVNDWEDSMDFMCKAKVQKSHRLEWGGVEMQKVSRFYVTDKDHGRELIKIMPPLAKNPTKERPTRIKAGHNVQICNDMKDATAPINRDYYIAEVRKLTDPFV